MSSWHQEDEEQDNYDSSDNNLFNTCNTDKVRSWCSDENYDNSKSRLLIFDARHDAWA